MSATTCTRCGKPLPENAKFCTACGNVTPPTSPSNRPVDSAPLYQTIAAPAAIAPIHNVPTSTVQEINNRYTKSVMQRYKDAYLVARTTVAIGKFFKVLGIVLAVVIIIGAAIAGSKFGYDYSNLPYPQQSGPEQGVLVGVTILLGGIMSASLTGGVLYILGILIAAQGQILKATLDSAVYGSCFISDEERATVMSLTSIF